MHFKTPRMMMSDLNHSLTDEEAEVWIENFIRTEKDIFPFTKKY